MKAVTLNEPGGPEKLVLSNVPDPEPKANEVVVRLHYAALNHVDVWLRTGNAAYPFTPPHIPGCDGAGVVEAMGPEAEGVAPGDPVLILPALSCGACPRCKKGQDNQCDKFEIFGTRRPGTYAEMTAVPDSNVVPLPEGFPLDKAAAFPLVYLTVWHMLFGRAQLTKGETVYVVGAGAGVGAAAIQLAKWKGARVLASTTDADKATRIKMLGTEVFVASEGQDPAAWVLDKTGGQGADVVVEHVGPATWPSSFKALGKYGRLVTCGATSGPSVQLELRSLFGRDGSILGARMGTAKEFQDLCRVMFSGAVAPVVDTVFPLEKVADAHRRFDERKHAGKILLKIA
jgi:NADPH:quinone reductase-like Zn-dependent oxidoreductase